MEVERQEHDDANTAVLSLLDRIRAEAGNAVYVEVLLRKADGQTLVGSAGYKSGES